MSGRGAIRPASGGMSPNTSIILKNGAVEAKVAGPLTVAELRQQAGNVSAQSNSNILVDGQPASDDTVVTNGQTVEFVRALGSKG